MFVLLNSFVIVYLVYGVLLLSALRYVLEIVDLLEKRDVSGDVVRDFFLERGYGGFLEFSVERLESGRGYTDFVRIVVRGSGEARDRVLGVIGRLGGISVWPRDIGLVSDADGAIVALATAYRLADMRSKGLVLPGDVIITTHICPRAIVIPHEPAPMVTSPVDLYELVKREVDPRMTAVLSVDATKANLVIKHTGFGFTPTIKEGWILRVSPDLVNVYMRVTGEPPVIVPITMQDLLPYTTKVYHINSMVQPWLYTKAPVVGIATTTKTVVPGSATGATNAYVLEQVVRFIVEVAKDYTRGKLRFYDENEWKTIMEKHGSVREILSRGTP